MEQGRPDYGNLNPDSRDLLNKFLEAAPYQDIGVLQGLDQKELDSFLSLLRAVTVGESLPLEWMWQLDYTEKPVDPYTFLTDPYYYGKQYESLWEGWIPELLYVLDPKNRIKEWIISGCIGSGKSSKATLAMVYKIYCLSLLRDPQKFFGLLEGSMICIGMFNTTITKTDQTLYYKFNELLYSIPYFRDRFSVVKNRSYKKIDDYQIILPKHIRIVPGSNASHALSLDLYGGILDEQNFREGSKILPYEETRAYDLYRQTTKRIESRFRGDAHSLLINVSSEKTQSDFTVEHIERVQDNPRVHITRFSLWDVNPKRYAGQKRFRVVVGTKYETSKILKLEDPTPLGRDVIEVPEEHRFSFEQDVEHALRDLAGVAIVGKGKLIPNKEKILSAVESGRSQGLEHPFSVEDIVLSLDDPFIIQDVFLPEKLMEYVGRMRRPIRHPDAVRFLHVDLAVSGDSAGISMGHISSTLSVSRLDGVSGKRVDKYLPVVEMDFMLRIRPPETSQIDFDKILEFVIYLRNALGYPIKLVTYDGYQSVHSIQILTKNGFNCATLSVDRKDEKYVALRQAILEGRFTCYEYAPFVDELAELIHDLKKQKVDHLKGKSKDVSDSVAGVVWNCLAEGSASAPLHPPIPKSVTKSPVMANPIPRSRAAGGWQMSDYAQHVGRRVIELSKRSERAG